MQNFTWSNEKQHMTGVAQKKAMESYVESAARMKPAGSLSGEKCWQNKPPADPRWDRQEDQGPRTWASAVCVLFS